jgi:hypothetical protein
MSTYKDHEKYSYIYVDIDYYVSNLLNKSQSARAYTLRRDLLKDCLVWIDRLVRLAAPQMKRCVKRLRRRRGPPKRGAVHNLIMSRYRLAEHAEGVH